MRCRPDAWETPFADGGERRCTHAIASARCVPARRSPPRPITPKPPQGGCGAGPCNITRHYAKRPHARPSLVNAAASHNAALCVNGPEGSPPDPRRGPGLCASHGRPGCLRPLARLSPRAISNPAQPGVSARRAPAASRLALPPAPAAPSKSNPPPGPCLRSCRGWRVGIAPGPVFGKGEMNASASLQRPCQSRARSLCGRHARQALRGLGEQAAL